MKTPHRFAPFRTLCKGCGEPVLVKPTAREKGITCRCGHCSGPWPDIPHGPFLPGDHASLREVIRFSDAFNPLPYFQDLWGEDYSTKVRELWERHARAFKEDGPPPSVEIELLMCLQYDIVLGPALGVGESQKLRFLMWLIKGLGDKAPIGD